MTKHLYWRVVQEFRRYRNVIDKSAKFSTAQFFDIHRNNIVDGNDFQLDDREDEEIPDFVPSGHKGVMFIKSESFSEIYDIIGRNPHNVSLIKVLDLYMYIPEIEISGFDFLRAIYERYDDGDIYRIQNLFLVDGFCTEHDLFRLSDNHGTRFELISSNKFKERYEELNMKGLRFELAVSS